MDEAAFIKAWRKYLNAHVGVPFDILPPFVYENLTYSPRVARRIFDKIIKKRDKVSA